MGVLSGSRTGDEETGIRQHEAAEVEAEAMLPNWDKRVGVGKRRARIPHMRLHVGFGTLSTATHFHCNISA